jgi:hypothetical protein
MSLKGRPFVMGMIRKSKITDRFQITPIPAVQASGLVALLLKVNLNRIFQQTIKTWFELNERTL